MTENTQQQRKNPDGSDRGSTDALNKQGGAHRDPASRGRTTIADGVVEKIAGLAARDVVGVHAMGSGASRTLGAMRDRVPGGNSSKSAARGVKAEVGEVQAAIDLEIVVEYGESIGKVTRDVRKNVITAVERMAGLEVVEVNISVTDVKLPDEDDDDDDSDSRVQ
ncbi:Asp23/Gls24 family envelope stress response protein [Streptomyces tsukubensis]|uniref:Stress protein n=1 Tax=Streptomyces tsukubensis TaxID=83656 RepID=A0A1V4A3L1_9ACTN|nr:Asp23/Gls24 family envelope stress response protein [Streptomyces tsukubensis]OON74010.1 stress protein [Streptomyces tsukubensis]QFR92943.1 Asp23/Gls24 family envelope stress response protein [Streptomyces tsukubensis]